MKKAILLTVVLGLWSASAALAQDTLWARTYGGEDIENAYWVDPTADGGFIVAGETWGFGAGMNDFYIVKTDEFGDTLWTRTYGGVDRDRAYSIHQTADGGYFICGYTESFSARYFDFWLVRIDQDGDTLWTRSYGTSQQYETCYSGNLTGDGGYVMAGSVSGTGEFYAVRVDSLGNALWTQTYKPTPTAYVYEAHSIQETDDGGYIMAGHGDSLYVVRTDSNGDVVWDRTYGEGAHAYAVQQTTDGGYAIAGDTPIAGWYDMYLMKTDEFGDTLWTRRYKRGDNERSHAHSLRQTSDGGYILAGYTFARSQMVDSVFVVKTDAVGDTIWTRVWGGWTDDQAYCIQTTDDGGYIVAGYTASFGAGADDFYLIKIISVPLVMNCQTFTPIFCRGGDFYFKIRVTNYTEGNLSGILAFSGYRGYDCDPQNLLVALPRQKTFPPGFSETYYYFKAPNAAVPGRYSTSVGGVFAGHEVFCCMNTDIIQCSPFKTGDNSTWELVEVDRSEATLPRAAELYQNYPNPFNAATRIGYSLAEAGNVSLKVYDISGRFVATLVEGYEDPGEHVITWNASDISSGVYFYKLTASLHSEVKRMSLLK